MEPTFYTIDQAATALSERKISAVELIKASLTQTKLQHKQLNSFVTITEDMALEQATASDQRRQHNQSRGLLDGIPIALKDVITTKGIRTTASSNILRNFVPPYDAFVWQKLRDAGSVLIGKTNLDEFAMGTTTEYSAFGPTKNPWDATLVAGGSSGGSAVAVAAGGAVGALGSDTGGSIRLPASWCGVVGLRPTYGRVSRYGVIAMASSLDQIGTFTRTVKDAAYVLETIAGHDAADSTSVPAAVPAYTKALRHELKGVRIGVVKQFFGPGVDDHIQAAVHQGIAQLQKLGAEMIDVSLPLAEAALATYCIITPAEVSTNLERYDGIKFGYSAASEASVHTLLDVYMESRAKGFGAEAKRRIMLGSYVLSAGYYEAYYHKAQQVRRLIQDQFSDVFTKVDCLVGPVSPTSALPLGQAEADPLKTWMADVLAVPVNIAGLPGMSVPCGFDRGLPIGLHLIADQFKEENLFAVASAFEASTDWHTRRPILKGEHDG